MEALENIYEFLKEKCEEAGTNFTEVCREAKVNRDLIEKWKNDNPKTLQTLSALIDAIDSLAKKNKKKVITSIPGIKLTRKR